MSSDKKSARARGSDPPRDQLKFERDEFLKKFFQKGAKLTEELVKEREGSRQRITTLEEENARLRAQIASDEAIRDLLKKIELLEKEKEDVIRRYHEVEAIHERTEESVLEIESELANLANLYVASYQLHTSLNPRGVIGHMKELMAQLMGAESFAIYLVDESGKNLVAVASEGVSDGELAAVPVGEGIIGETFLTGEEQIRSGDTRQGTLRQPAACIPLRVDNQVKGVIVVFQTLEQKEGFLAVDHELFKLLGAQGMWALVAARLYTDRGREIPPLSSFRDLGI